MGRYPDSASPHPHGGDDGGNDERPLPGGLRFLRLIWAVSHELESYSKRTERRLGITMPQRLVLRLLGHGGPLTSGELSAALHLHPSTLTGILKRLEARGLVERHDHPDDGRRRMFGLTPAGRRFDRREFELEMLVDTALSKLRPAEQEAARRALDALAESLSNGQGQ